MADLLDPDVAAQLYVLQWMHENGLHDALKALERQLGRLYDASQLPEASRLMQLVWKDCEERLQSQDEADDDCQPATAAAAGTSGADGSGAASAATSGQAPAAAGSGSAAAAGTGGAAGRRARQEEAMRLLRAGADDYAGPCVLADTPPEAHRANVIAVRIVPGQDCVVTAAGDGCVRCVRLPRCAGSSDGGGGGAGDGSGSGAGGGGSSGSGGAEVVWETRVGSAALLSLALHPQYSSGLPLVAVGSMDGRVAVLHGPTGRLLAQAQAHTKYVVRVAWGSPPPSSSSSAAAAAVGEAAEAATATASAEQEQQQEPRMKQKLLLTTASTDETVGIHALDVSMPLDAGAATGGGGAGGGEAQGGEGGSTAAAQLATVKQVPYGTAVADVAFLRDGRTLAVGVRGSNYLRLLDTAALLLQAGGAGGGSTGCVPETLVNMNERGDDHVSFSARQLVLSPCGQYLLVCTDGPRLLVLRTADWSRLRMLFGLPVDQFPQPAAAWHRDSNYVYAAGAGAQLCVFHLGSGRLVWSGRHHKVNIRDLDYDPARNLLASCSFDKTVKLMGPTTV